MRVLLFGATGMVGQGVLRECLLAPDVDSVVVIVRTSTRQKHPKLHEILHRDFSDFSSLALQLRGVDACFFCLGVSSVGMTEVDYVRVTYDITISAAQTLLRMNPDGMTFVYVSGRSTDSTEKGPVMWARAKGRTENALRRMRFKAVYLFRPGIIQPLHGIRSKTPAYQTFYTLATPLLWTMRTLLPASVLTTESIGIAMLNVARRGAPKAVLEAKDIREAARV
jgi:uncharacterized protein YbjT (DUF2867 family)